MFELTGTGSKGGGSPLICSVLGTPGSRPPPLTLGIRAGVVRFEGVGELPYPHTHTQTDPAELANPSTQTQTQTQTRIEAKGEGAEEGAVSVSLVSSPLPRVLLGPVIGRVDHNTAVVLLEVGGWE